MRYDQGVSQAQDASGELFNFSERQWNSIEVSLTLSHSDLDPDSVSDLLGLTPTRSARPGTAIMSSDGIWAIDFHGQDPQDNPLEMAVSSIRDHLPKIKQLISFGVSAQLSIYGHVQDGSTLHLSTNEISSLAEMSIPIVFVPNANER